MMEKSERLLSLAYLLVTQLVKERVAPESYSTCVTTPTNSVKMMTHM